jgi:hypothetical protein
VQRRRLFKQTLSLDERLAEEAKPVLFCAGEHRSIANVTTLRRSEIEL